MATAYIDVEDYLWFNEDIQGNVNVAGLVWDDTIEDAFDLAHDAYTVWVDQLEEEIGIADEIDQPYHHLAVAETIDLRELFGGAPTRVRQSVLNIAYTKPMMPIRIGHMHLDVIVGSDTFIEEVSSELQCHSTYANAVPYWWETIYETFDIDMTEPQPLPPITLGFSFVVNDLLVDYDEIIQDYEFTSRCDETLFIWAGHAWGWIHENDESLDMAGAVQEIIGKIADEYVLLEDGTNDLTMLTHLVNDTVFSFDRAWPVWEMQVEETVGVAESVVWPFEPTAAVNEEIDLADSGTLEPVFFGLATESLVFADFQTLVQEVLIEEGMAIGDVPLLLWTVSLLLAEGFGIEEIIS